MRGMLVLGLCLLMGSQASAIPLEFAHQGRLADGTGAMLDGSHTVMFKVFDAQASGSELWSEEHTLEFDAGYYSAALGSITGIDPLIYDGDELWVELTVDGQPPLPTRIRLVSVPFAIKAFGVAGGVVDASEIRIDGTTIIDGDGMSWTNLTDVPAGLEDGVDNDALSELACTDGDLISSSGGAWGCLAPTIDTSLITSGTLDVGRLPVGTSSGDVAAGDHKHDAADVISGVFDSALIPDLDAAKIATGTLDASRIPSLDAAKVATGVLAAGRIPDIDASKTVSGVFDPARIPAPDLIGAVPANGGTFTGDVVFEGDVVIAGASLPYTTFVTGTAWSDVTWTGANETLDPTWGYMTVGASFSGSNVYQTIEILPAGLVESSDKLLIEVEWIRDCVTGDCDTVTFIFDSANNWAKIGTYDNDGGRINPGDSAGINQDFSLNRGTPNHVQARFTVGGGEASNLAWVAHFAGGQEWGSQLLNVVFDPSGGMSYRVSRGDAGESYTERMLHVKVSRR